MAKEKWGLKAEISGYVKYDDYTPMHWHVYNEHYGKRPAGYDIHHIDWNKCNNDPKNLIALSKEVHRRAHAEGSPSKPIPRTQLEKWQKEWEDNCRPHINKAMEDFLVKAPDLQIAQLQYMVEELTKMADGKKLKQRGNKKGQTRKEKLDKRKAERKKKKETARKAAKRRPKYDAEKYARKRGVVSLKAEVG